RQVTGSAKSTPGIAESRTACPTFTDEERMLATLGTGLAAGLHAATWGMYKDSLYEGFSRGKYLRSIVLGMCAALLAQAIRPQAMETAGGIALIFGLTYVLERVVTEWLKLFLRVED